MGGRLQEGMRSRYPERKRKNLICDAIKSSTPRDKRDKKTVISAREVRKRLSGGAGEAQER